MKSFAGIILAAGKGRRLGSFHGNKVLAPFRGKPLIVYALNLLQKQHIPSYVVVGYGKEKVISVLGKQSVYVDQNEQLGTGHAVLCALAKIPARITDIIVLMGDHSFSLSNSLLTRLIQKHVNANSDITILTVITKNINGYGLVLREGKDNIVRIMDGKHILTPLVVTQGEITPGVYCFKTSFLKEYLKLLPKHEKSQEYYLSDLIGLAHEKGKKISSIVLRDEKLAVGINTLEDLKKAELLIYG
jgi:bifunctional N-acetylglucosamine-1-phosphate-uridyltransferase/glucosamine-1-phosphate-acetyltransferase GlmU-like protein